MESSHFLPSYPSPTGTSPVPLQLIANLATHPKAAHHESIRPHRPTEKAGGVVVEAACVIELPFLKGRDKIQGTDLFVLVEKEGL